MKRPDLIISLAIIISALGVFALYGYVFKPTTPGCTMEARLCPDGTAVGRTGPYCEFEACPDGTAVDTRMTEAEARAIAEAICIKGGESLKPGYYNETTKTWWFDANFNAVRPGCNPACVVSENTGKAEINWRCTGAIPPDGATSSPSCSCPAGYYLEGEACNPDCYNNIPRCLMPSIPCAGKEEAVISDFEDCVAAGNPVMESYPRQCRAGGRTFVEEIKDRIFCTDKQRQADFCAQVYDPVCAKVNVQCIKAPCYPVDETFSNACEACKNALVESYIGGECR